MVPVTTATINSERRQYPQFTRQTGQNRPSASFYRIGVLPTEYPFVIPVANGGILAAIIAGREIPEGTLDSPVIQGFNPLTGKTKCQCVQIRETRHRLWCREPAEANDIIIYLNSVHNDYPVEPNPNLIDFNVVDPQDTILSIQVAEVPVCHDLVDQFLPMFTQKI